MSATSRLRKALSLAVFANESFRQKVYRAVMYPSFVNWCREHPSVGLRTPEQGRESMYGAVLRSQKLEGPICYLEFGVYRGKSIRWWVENNRHPDSRFVGFDSFEGLPEDWKEGFPKGLFSTEGKVPAIDDARCSFEKGWFSDTLRPYLQRHEPRERLVLHLDADLYGATLYVLTTLAPLLRVDDVIIFDEFRDYIHEYRALVDFCSAYPVAFEAIANHDDYRRVALRIRSLN
jgi:hypothetical protein